MSMTKEALAALLNGREYSNEITREEAKQAKADGLIVLFGYSDDNIEIRGAFHDEVGMNDGGEIFLHRGGILPDYESIDCPECQNRVEKDEKKCAVIECKWSEGDYSWFIQPRVTPFAPFDIMKDGEKFCRGVVIAVADLPSLTPKSRFSYVNVTSPGAEGTINLMWGDYPIQWINSPEIAAGIKEFLDGEKKS